MRIDINPWNWSHKLCIKFELYKLHKIQYFFLTFVKISYFVFCRELGCKPVRRRQLEYIRSSFRSIFCWKMYFKSFHFQQLPWNGHLQITTTTCVNLPSVGSASLSGRGINTFFSFIGPVWQSKKCMKRKNTCFLISKKNWTSQLFTIVGLSTSAWRYFCNFSRRIAMSSLLWKSCLRGKSGNSVFG